MRRRRVEGGTGHEVTGHPQRCHYQYIITAGLGRREEEEGRRSGRIHGRFVFVRFASLLACCDHAQRHGHEAEAQQELPALQGESEQQGG